MSLISKIRVRSIIRVNTLGEEIQVQTIEGSPEIRTINGETITLKEKEMTTISREGKMGEKTTFDSASDLTGWSNTIADWQRAAGDNIPGSTQGSMSTWMIIAMVAGVVVLGVIGFGFNRRRKLAARSTGPVLVNEAVISHSPSMPPPLPVSSPPPAPKIAESSPPVIIPEKRVVQDTGSKCSSCGAFSPAGALYCNQCASSLKQEKLVQEPAVRAASGSDIKCPNCGAASLPEAKFCSRCAAQLQVQTPSAKTASLARFCPLCGTARRADKPFCSTCGNRFKS